LYRAELEILLSLPEGPEFGARALKRIDENGDEASLSARKGRLLLYLVGANGDGVAFNLSRLAAFDMVQKNGNGRYFLWIIHQHLDAALGDN